MNEEQILEAVRDSVTYARSLLKMCSGQHKMQVALTPSFCFAV